MIVKEVPSDHDFFDPAYVKHWTESISRYRPERNRLFEVFAAEAARIKNGALSVFELGCGPGFLAEALLKNCEIARYTLVDLASDAGAQPQSPGKVSRPHGFHSGGFQKSQLGSGDSRRLRSRRLAPGRARASPCEPYPETLCSAPQPAASRKNHFDLRSRQFFLALRSSSGPFHDGRRAFVDLQESWFYQRKRNLPRRRLEPDGNREALGKLIQKVAAVSCQ